MLNSSNELNVAMEESKYQEAIAPMSSIEERVKKIVVEQLGVSDDQVTPDASFVDDLGADSLDTVELVMALEEEFEAEIPDDEAEKITTVKQAVEFIQKNTNTWLRLNIRFQHSYKAGWRLRFRRLYFL